MFKLDEQELVVIWNVSSKQYILQGSYFFPPVNHSSKWWGKAVLFVCASLFTVRMSDHWHRVVVECPSLETFKVYPDMVMHSWL